MIHELDIPILECITWQVARYLFDEEKDLIKMCRTIVGQPYFIVGRMSYSFFQTPLFIVFLHVGQSSYKVRQMSDRCPTIILRFENTKIADK